MCLGEQENEKQYFKPLQLLLCSSQMNAPSKLKLRHGVLLRHEVVLFLSAFCVGKYGRQKKSAFS